jgi:hypothetical protein
MSAVIDWNAAAELSILDRTGSRLAAATGNEATNRAVASLFIQYIS